MNEPTEENATALIHCHACGRENPAGHKFCGSCGAPLAQDSDPHPSLRVESTPADDRIEDRSSGREDSAGGSAKAGRDPYDLSLFRSFSANETSDEEPRSHYRVYIGLILALILSGLGYKAYRSMQATPQGLQEAPPPAVTPQKATPAATPTAPPANSEKITPPPLNNTAGEKPASPPRPSTTTKPEQKETRTNAQPAPAAGDNGAQELAVAQRYLSGTNGQMRDGAQAARWLWKSVAKQNPAATLLLADLYLKGDGVPKSCDQARLLLDSAARKDIPGAGERLRNLQAFGCQ